MLINSFNYENKRRITVKTKTVKTLMNWLSGVLEIQLHFKQLSKFQHSIQFTQIEYYKLIIDMI